MGGLRGETTSVTFQCPNKPGCRVADFYTTQAGITIERLDAEIEEDEDTITIPYTITTESSLEKRLYDACLRFDRRDILSPVPQKLYVGDPCMVIFAVDGLSHFDYNIFCGWNVPQLFPDDGEREMPSKAFFSRLQPY